jgi:fatty-acyl-CoA synthase
LPISSTACSSLKYPHIVCCRNFHHRQFQEPRERIVSYAYGFPEDPLSCQTLGEALKEAVSETPDKPFLSFPHQDIGVSFKKLYEDASRLASNLQSMGIKKGDRVGIWSPNRYEWVVTQFATALFGAILVNVNPGYRELEFKYCVNLVGCKTLIFCQSFRSSDYSKILDNLSNGILQDVNSSGTLERPSPIIPSLKNFICLDVDSKLGEKDTCPANVPRLSQLLASSVEEVYPEEALTFDDPINIQFTSGTTGHPKAALLSHHNIVNNAYFAGKVFLKGLNEPIVICVPNPLYHCFGCVNGVITGLLFRSQVVVPAPTAIASKTLATIDKYKCNIVYGTPTMFVDLLSEKLSDSGKGSQHKGDSIERVIMSGAPCPEEIIVKVRNHVFPSIKSVLIPYGTTECSPVITMVPHDAKPEYMNTTVGPPIEHNEVKVSDPETGKVVRIGVRGEVSCRGYTTFQGYYGQEDKTREVIDSKNGWYKTGDLGVMNKDGYLSITGRIKDMIIRGGENIYPREVEDFLLTYDLVKDCNVVGIPDERMGEEVAAFLVLREDLKGIDHDSIKQQIRSFCKGRIAHFKIPQFFFFVSDFPRTVTMKVQKHKLKELAVEMLKKQSGTSVH